MIGSHSYLDVRDEPGRRVLTIRRPERGNALGTTLARTLGAALDAARALPADVRALVLTAEPVVRGAEATWVAGGDLKELAAVATPAEAEAYARAMTGFCRGLDELPVPVVVAVDGAAIGGGAELALAGDVRLATARTRLEFKQLKVGLATGYGSARRLVDLVGLARAQSLLYGCRVVGADEALALGLFAQVAADAAALKALVDEVCRELAALAPEALRAQKRMLRAAVTLHPGAVEAAERAEFVGAWGNPAHKAFLDRFTGKGGA